MADGDPINLRPDQFVSEMTSDPRSSRQGRKSYDPDIIQPNSFVSNASKEKFALAFWLILTLLLSVLVHYSATVVLEWNDKGKASESLSRIFHAWLPVISGFVGSAVAYHFTKKE